MISILFKWAVFIHLTGCFCSNQIDSTEKALDFLKGSGYLESYDEPRKGEIAKIQDPKSMQLKGFKLYQLIHRLNTTGQLDAQTKKQLNTPRCGLSDFTEHGHIAQFKAVRNWTKPDLKFYISNESRTLRDKSRKAIQDAFNYWSEYTPLTFRETKNQSDAQFTIMFGNKNHGDPFPFDAKGGVLAHAFFPEHGGIHFDDDENFTESTFDGVNLRIVATHEIGHALGLEHSLDKKALMYPYYGGYIENFSLDQDDIEGIQFLYGKRRSIYSATTSTRTQMTVTTKPVTDKHSSKKSGNTSQMTQKPTTTVGTTTTSTKTTTTTTRTTPTTTKTTTSKVIAKLTTKQTAKTSTAQSKSATTTTRHSKELTFPNFLMLPCIQKNNAIFLSSDKKHLYFRLDYDDYLFWVFDIQARKWVGKSSVTNFKLLPHKLKGGVTDSNGTVWFFRGRELWAYNGNNLAAGYPKRMEDRYYPFHPGTAAFKDSKLFVFKYGLAFEVDAKRARVLNINSASQIFPGVIGPIDTVFQYQNHHYIFSDRKVYLFDGKMNRIITGYPKPISSGWFPCLA